MIIYITNNLSWSIVTAVLESINPYLTHVSFFKILYRFSSVYQDTNGEDHHRGSK